MLVVVRHGRTAWNAARRYQGWADVPLDEEGRRQSAAAAAGIVDALTGRPVSVVSSDLRRAVETAALLAAGLDGAVLVGPPAVDPHLREVDVGAWEGLTNAEAEEKYPEEYRRWALGEDVARGGGETLADAGARVAAAIAARLPDSREVDGREPHPEPRPSPSRPRPHLVGVGYGLVVVGHGMSLQAGVRMLVEADRVRLPEGMPDVPHLGNASYLVLPT